MGRRKGGGGKLNRNEILQARLNSKLRLGAEILARSQRRTLSSLIETLIESAIEEQKVPVVLSDSAQIDVHLLGKRKTQKLSIKEITDRIWSTDDAERFAAFALFLPDLLTTEEVIVWELITNIPYFWEHFEISVETKAGKLLEKQPWPLVNHSGLILEHLQEHWPLIKSILDGKAKAEKLKQLKLPVGRIVKKPDDYPHHIKKVSQVIEKGT